MNKMRTKMVAAALLVGLTAAGASAHYYFKYCHRTSAPAQMCGMNGWDYRQVFTVGESINGYTPVGILDGLGAWKPNDYVVQVLANHELASGGYTYYLDNGLGLDGARVSYFNFDAYKRCIIGAGPAYGTIYDRCGKEVKSASQLDFGRLSRLCSSQLVMKGTYGFVDTIYFTGEENSDSPGGTEWALDVKGRALWAVPAMGRGAWENVSPFDTGNKHTVGLLMGDDRSGAPILMYIGYKKPGGSFLERNGLAYGTLYAWKAKGASSPQDFNGKGSKRWGSFVPVPARVPYMAGKDGYDSKGYADLATLQAFYDKVGVFQASRPEDVSVNPRNGRQLVLASTGRGGDYPADNWGTLYVINIKLGWRYGKCFPSALVEILYDGDDSGNMDYGIRSPDNVDWADDGIIYVQEDRSTSPSSAFGGTSGEEASVWAINPKTCATKRIAQMKRGTQNLPSGQTDPSPNDIGNWESSGVLDVTKLFYTWPGERLLIGDVQAHSVRDGSISSLNLSQGGQLFFLSMRNYPSWWKKYFVNGEN